MFAIAIAQAGLVAKMLPTLKSKLQFRPIFKPALSTSGIDR
jgi:hypothetical protein